MQQQPRLIEDAAERYKLKVSLPGGRYQLSLDNRAVNVLMNDLGLEVRDTVPEPFVPFFVAMGDAWFPNERDTAGIVGDLRSGGNLSPSERDVLITYVSESLIPEARESHVQSAISDSPIADAVDPGDLNINSLPEIPSGYGLLDSEDSKSDQVEATGDTESTADTTEPSESDVVETLQEIPGIGTQRATAFAKAGITSLAEIAESRPIELSTIDGITEGVGAVAVEGARELLGQKTPASERLANQTGAKQSKFNSTLNSLAASGVPATEAEDTLRTLYGPTVADVAGVTGQQAYYLWEAGYQTPYDLTEASLDELTDVYQIGETTAPKIRDNARELVTEHTRDSGKGT